MFVLFFFSHEFRMRHPGHTHAHSALTRLHSANLPTMWYHIEGKKKSALKCHAHYCETFLWLCVLITCVPVWKVIEVRVQDAEGPRGAAKPEEELKAWA